MVQRGTVSVVGVLTRIFLEPVLRFGPKRLRHWLKKFSTNSRLPMTAPSVK